MKEKNPSSFIHRIGKVLTEGTQREGFSTALVLEPERGTKQAKGSLFFVLDIAGGDAVVASEMGRTLMEVFEEAFYANPNADFDDSFEKGLKAVNNELKAIAEEGEKSWIGKLFGIIAATSGKKLLLAHRGTAEAYLVRGGKIHHLTSGLYTPGEAPRPESTFVHVIEGDLKVGDKLLISTAEPFYYFSVEKLRKIIEENSPAQAAKILGDKLKDEEETQRSNLLLVEFTLPELLAIEDLEEETESEQIVPMKSKEKAAAKSREEASVSVPAAARKISMPRLDRKTINEATNFITLAGNILWQILKWLGLVLLTILDWIVGFLTVQIARIKKRKGGNRILLGAGAALVLLIILISISVGSGGGISTRAASRALDQALQKENAAKAALIYEDKAQAGSLYMDAYNLLQTAAKNNRYKDQATSQLAMVQTQLDQLNNVFRVKSQDPIVDFANLKSQLVTTTGSDVTVTAKGLLYLNGDIYSFDPNNNKVYKYGGVAKQAAVVNSLVSNDKKLTASTVAGVGLIFYTTPPAIYNLDIATNKLTQQTLADNTNFSNATEINYFGTTLYLLDPSNNQIWRYRYQTQSNNYISIAPYFAQAKPDISKASAMAIDGSIYLLVDGQVQKFISGASASIAFGALPAPSASLGKIQDIFASNATSGLYLLDAANKRVVVFDKTGQYRSQYIIDNIDNPEKIWVDEGAKIMLVKTGTKVYRIQM